MPLKLTTRVLAIVTTVILIFPQPAVRGVPPQPYSATHRLPVAGDVLRPAEIPEQNWHSGHRGVDLAATPGQVILASRGGEVHFAGQVAGTPVVSIQHSDGIRTTYEPVIASVKKGMQVKRGQPIGRLADPSSLSEHARRSPGLSWGAKTGADSYIDPLSLLGSPRIVLKD